VIGNGVYNSEWSYRRNWVMVKFKVGDKVRILHTRSAPVAIGDTGIICAGMNGEPFVVAMDKDNKNWTFTAKDLEFATPVEPKANNDEEQTAIFTHEATLYYRCFATKDEASTWIMAYLLKHHGKSDFQVDAWVSGRIQFLHPSIGSGKECD
jgi:hypothetical protein